MIHGFVDENINKKPAKLLNISIKKATSAHLCKSTQVHLCFRFVHSLKVHGFDLFSEYIHLSQVC